jgi:arsenate reductase-like glutaredoxin family protein
MDKDYFIKLLSIYCKEVHLNSLCDECKKVLEEFENNTLDINVYYKILSYNSYIFKRFHFHTFNKLCKKRLEDLTKY